MDSLVWMKWLSEPRAISSIPGLRHRTLFVDNYASHVVSESIQGALEGIRTTLRKLPPNATDLVQPADSLIIQKIKDVWRERWDRYKYDCIKNGSWKDGIEGSGSGRLLNPGKRIFFKLAADAVKDVDNQRDDNGI